MEMAKFICARCKGPVLEGRPEGQSALYGSNHRLCEPCFFEEDEEIDSEGTNNLPGTLRRYGISNGGLEA